MIYKTEEIFKTEGFPEFTFIDPPNFQNIIIDIRSPHKPVVFEGASGTGKTSAIRAALSQSGNTEDEIDFLSARSPEDLIKIEEISNLGKLKKKITVIDDFHRLTTDIQKKLSDMLRLMADNPNAINGKLIIAGINEVGQRLIAVSEDLLKRMAVYRIKPAEKEKAIESLEKGSTLLNVIIDDLDKIYDEAKGDYWSLQKLCRECLLSNGIFESGNHVHVALPDLKKLRAKITEDLSLQFKPLMQDFIRGVRFRKTNQAYYHLMNTFAKCNTASMPLNSISIKYPHEKARIDAIKSKRLPELLKSKKEVAKKFYYDPQTTIFSVEDPALAYFIQNTDWQAFASEAGFPITNNFFDYEIGISFAGEQREFAKMLADSFINDDISVFYDEYQDLLGRDLELALEEAYSKKSQYVVVVISEEYKKKQWTSFERAVWDKRMKENCILPIFIDDVIIKEVSTSICRIDFRQWKAHKNNDLNKEEFLEHFEVLTHRIKNVLENR